MKNEKKGNTEMNKNITNLANAKEAYINCDGAIIPIRIEKIEQDWLTDIKIICTLPSTIDIPYHKIRKKSDFAIKDVIFNPPATIVFWTDNTKTVVKAGEHDIYDPEKGLAMAITKRVLGNEGNYYNEIRKWVEPYMKKCEENCTPVEKALKNLGEALRKNYSICNPIGKVTNIEQTEEGLEVKVEVTDEKWKIWFEKRNDFDEVFGYDVYPTEYKNKSSARRRAKQIFNGTNIGWVVSKTDPWDEESDVSCQA